MDTLTLICDDCGGIGVDPGSLNEPEACPVCLGGGKTYVELDTRSSHYGIRKPVARVASIGNGIFVRVGTGKKRGRR